MQTGRRHAKAHLQIWSEQHQRALLKMFLLYEKRSQKLIFDCPLCTTAGGDCKKCYWTIFVGLEDQRKTLHDLPCNQWTKKKYGYSLYQAKKLIYYGYEKQFYEDRLLMLSQAINYYRQSIGVANNYQQITGGLHATQ